MSEIGSVNDVVQTPKRKKKKFFADLGSQKGKLKPTTTQIKTVTGRRYVEDEEGNRTWIEGDNYGFVEDTSPDDECHEVIPFLYIGSQNAAANREGLEQNGVKAIVNVATGIPYFFEEGDFDYLNIECLDIPEFNCRPFFFEAIKWMDKFISNEQGVLVHCNAGVSRSASFCIAYLISKREMSYEEALAQVRLNRACARPNDGFVDQLKSFELFVSVPETTTVQYSMPAPYTPSPQAAGKKGKFFSNVS